MRVCFLTHYFPPEVGAPQTRIELLARTLAARGHEVAVHTGFPHYPDGAIRAPYRNRPWLVERRDGVRIVRSAVMPMPNRGFLIRLLDHTALAASALLTARLSGPLDVVVAETPPLFTAAAGALYAAAKGAALVVNVADRWPASAVELGALSDPRAIAAAHALEHWVYRRADIITSPTRGIAETLARTPAAAGRTLRMWPVVDTERFAAVPPVQPRVGRPLRVLYAGTIGLAQGLETLVKAVRLAGPAVVQAQIAGGGAEADALADEIARDATANVVMLGVQPSSSMPSLYAQADACVVLLRDVRIFRGALPTKMLEAMAAGRAVILSARGEAAELVTQAGAGLVVEPEDPHALAAALQALHDQPELSQELGAAGRRFAAERFGSERAADAWQGALDAAFAVRRRRSAPDSAVAR